MTVFAFPTHPAAKRSVAAWALLCFVAASLPIWPGAQALAAAPSPRAILECPDPEKLISSPKLAGEVWSDRLSHEPLCLYFAAGSFAATDAAKATDLYALARIRLQYDFARCEEWPHGSTSSAMAALRMTAEGALVQAGVKTMLPQLIAAARADETFDYELEDLAQRCDGGALKPASAWKAEQRRIQASAEAASKSSAP